MLSKERIEEILKQEIWTTLEQDYLPYGLRSLSIKNAARKIYNAQSEEK